MGARGCRTKLIALAACSKHRAVYGQLNATPAFPCRQSAATWPTSVTVRAVRAAFYRPAKPSRRHAVRSVSTTALRLNSDTKALQSESVFMALIAGGLTCRLITSLPDVDHPLLAASWARTSAVSSRLPVNPWARYQDS